MVELVIRIDDETYKEVMERTEFDTLSLGIKLIEAVQNGIVLPKGHGRLIDESQIHKCGWDYVNHHGKTNADTIIEADKENKE